MLDCCHVPHNSARFSSKMFQECFSRNFLFMQHAKMFNTPLKRSIQPWLNPSFQCLAEIKCFDMPSLSLEGLWCYGSCLHTVVVPRTVKCTRPNLVGGLSKILSPWQLVKPKTSSSSQDGTSKLFFWHHIPNHIIYASPKMSFEALLEWDTHCSK